MYLRFMRLFLFFIYFLIAKATIGMFYVFYIRMKKSENQLIYKSKKTEITLELCLTVKLIKIRR